MVLLKTRPTKKMMICFGHFDSRWLSGIARKKYMLFIESILSREKNGSRFKYKSRQRWKEKETCETVVGTQRTEQDREWERMGTHNFFFTISHSPKHRHTGKSGQLKCACWLLKRIERRDILWRCKHIPENNTFNKKS